jgi:hypothetical protein
MRKTLLTLLICFNVIYAFSQQDTVTVSTAEPDSVDVKYDRLYKLFLEENKQEIEHLLKVDLLAFALYSPNLSFEQKLSRKFSCETGLNFSYYVNSELLSRYVYNMYIRQYDFHYFFIGGYEKIKYYYNLNRRQQIGKNINGFAGNYFALSFNPSFSRLKSNYNYVYHNDTTSVLDGIHQSFTYSIGVVYGLQRRIGNIGYIEPSFSFNVAPYSSAYNPQSVFYNESVSYYFNIHVQVGFAIESFSKLRRMLKK